MTKRIHAKHKIDRRLGENIWGRPKSPFNKREYGPGEHGQRRRGKLSDYGQQLRAKQKLKGYYGNITEKQFKAIYREAARLQWRHLREADRPARASASTPSSTARSSCRPCSLPGSSSATAMCGSTAGASTSPSYRCREGDVVEVRGQGQGRRHGARSRAEPRARRARLYRGRPQQDDGQAHARSPTLSDVPYPVIMEPNLVIEFYSR